MANGFPKCEKCGAERGGFIDLERVKREETARVRAARLPMKFSEWPLICRKCAKGAGAGGDDRARVVGAIERGLRCLRCRSLFEHALEFVEHECFIKLREEQQREAERRAPREREELGQLRLFARTAKEEAFQ